MACSGGAAKAPAPGPADAGVAPTRDAGPATSPARRRTFHRWRRCRRPAWPDSRRRSAVPIPSSPHVRAFHVRLRGFGRRGEAPRGRLRGRVEDEASLAVLRGQQSDREPHQENKFRAEANHCYRVYVAADEAVKDSVVVVRDSAGDIVVESPAPAAPDDGKVCFTTSDDVTLLVGVGMGRARGPRRFGETEPLLLHDGRLDVIGGDEGTARGDGHGVTTNDNLARSSFAASSTPVRLTPWRRAWQRDRSRMRPLVVSASILD